MTLGIGVDIIEVRRIRQAVEKWGDDFLNRIFTQKELENAKTRGSLYQHLAGRFAVKEAIFKALNDSGLNWKDLQVLNDKQGRPYCEILNIKKNKINVLISISHIKNYATAFAVITQKT